MSVHQHADKLATGIFAVFTVGIGGFQQRLNILFGDQVMNGILLIFGQRCAVEQQSDRIGNMIALTPSDHMLVPDFPGLPEDGTSMWSDGVRAIMLSLRSS